MAADETIPELPIKDVIFRIHRDIRFSKDPTPYKVRTQSIQSTVGKAKVIASLLRCVVSNWSQRSVRLLLYPL